MIIDVDYLLSFKNNENYQELDEEYLKNFGLIVKQSKKSKKKFNKSSEKKTLNILKNDKLQISKDKIKNKFGLILNKLDKNNSEKIIKEFLHKFKEINYEEFEEFQICIFLRMLNDLKFQEIYFSFYLKIKEILNVLYNFNDKFFINLIEFKFKLDYCNYNISDDKILANIEKINSEENRINNLNLIKLLLRKNYLSTKIIDELCDSLINTSYIPDIYFLFTDEFLSNNIKVNNYRNQLCSKIKDLNCNQTNSSRYKILLSRILELDQNFNDTFEINELIDENIEDGYDSDFNSISNIDDILDQSDERTEFEIEIENILNEYILIEDLNEINNFLKNYYELHNNEIMISEFLNYLISFYFKNNLNNHDKFKSLFLNFRNIDLVKPDMIKNSLIYIINSDTLMDFVNIDSKLNKLIEILKLLKIRFDESENLIFNKFIQCD